MKTKPTVISLFSGAGGLDFGFEAAGFETRVAVEMNHDACETLRTNTRWTVLERDINTVSSEELLEAAKLKAGEASALIGGPPCQPFSKAGYWSKGDALRLKDPRANTLSAYLRVLEDTQPECFLLENVEGLAYKNKDEGLELLLGAINGINDRVGTSYQPQLQVLNAADYGVPQLRKRVILVGTKTGRPFKFPEPTHADAENVGRLEGDLQPRLTAWDALSGLRPDRSEDLALRGKWADLLPSIPEGQNYLFHTSRGEGEPLFGWRTRYWSFLLKLAKNLPSWTIQAQPGPAIGPFHWDNRRLSVAELCRIQTFPDGIKLAGTRSSIQKQLGNAVPSLLGEVLASEIRKQVLDDPRRSPLKLMPKRQARTPAQADVKAVPRRFLKLRGEHAAHAGTGHGPAALQRSLL